MTTPHINPPPAAAARVQRVLVEARRRWFLNVWLSVLTQIALVAAAVILGAWIVTRATALTPGALLLLIAGALAAVLTFSAWRAWPLWRRPSDTRVARYVEERVPDLGEVFVSAVDCLHRPSSSLLTGLMFESAARQLEAVDLDRIVSRHSLRRRAVQLAGAAAGVLMLLVVARDPLLEAWDIVRMTIAPPVIRFEVASGDMNVREGSEVRLRARVLGLPPRIRREALKVAVDKADGGQQLPMTAQGDWEQAVLTDARSSFTYRVSGYGLLSQSYRVNVRPRPRVTQIDVHYDFPSFSGLKPRVDKDSGDVYAPAGTKIRLVVHTTVPVAGADLGLASGSQVPFAAAPASTLAADMVVTKDDAYRLTLVEADGNRTLDDTEYFVRTVEDRPPDVRIMRPASDRKVTRLEEVIIEARADDDFGVQSLELVYAARGKAEHVVRLGSGTGTSATGRHTLFIEDLDVVPGDFISYYARARDVARGKRSSEARSDIFFLEVRPFNEEFEAAQSSAMSGMSGGAFEDLAARQKELIIATWKLERRSSAGRSSDDIRQLARAQTELKTKAEQVANRMAPRTVQQRPRTALPNGVPTPPRVTDTPMNRAVEAMARSAKALEALQTGQAIPREMEALNQLLRAEAEIRRRQITQQQSAGGAGQTGNQDLSALFDRELQRQQQTQYENRTSSEDSQQEQKSDALNRLRELAKRQDDLSRKQQELARAESQLEAKEVQRQLEKLTREQEELRRQTQQLAAQLQQQQNQQNQQKKEQQGSRQNQSGEQGQQGQQGQSGSGSGQGSSSSQQVQAAADEMQQSAGGLGREQLKEAASKAQRAAEKLRQAERAMSGQQPDETARAAGDMQLEAAELAETERKIARELRAEGPAAADQLRQLAGEQERAAERASRLANRAESLGSGQKGQKDQKDQDGESGTGGSEAAARARTGQQIESQLRASARELRQQAERGKAGNGEGEGAEQKEAQRAENLARSLEGMARGLGQAGGRQDNRAELSEQLARAGELRDRLSQLTRQLRDGNRQPGQGKRQEAGQNQASQTSESQGQEKGQQPGGNDPGSQAAARPSASQEPSSSGSPGQPSSAKGSASGGGQGGGTTSGTPDTEEVSRELRSLGRLADGMGENNEGLQQALRTLEEYAPSRSAPGTEAWKQDFARWESLRREIAQSLERMETRTSAQLQTAEHEDRLDAGASDAAPEAYRRDVARYYRSLARKH